MQSMSVSVNRQTDEGRDHDGQDYEGHAIVSLYSIEQQRIRTIPSIRSEGCDILLYTKVSLEVIGPFKANQRTS